MNVAIKYVDWAGDTKLKLIKVKTAKDLIKDLTSVIEDGGAVIGVSRFE